MNHTNQRAVSRRRVYRILLPALLLGVLALWVHWRINLTELSQWLETSGPLAPILFVCVGIFLMSICVPKTVMSISAGALFGTGAGSGLMLVLAVTAALMNYHVGRWWIDQPSKRIGDLVDDSEVTEQESMIQSLSGMAAEAGFASHFLLRLTPIPTMILSYAMGSCRARQKPYLAAAAVAVIPQVLWVHSGTAAALAGDASTTTAQWVSIAIAMVGGVIVAIIVPREAMRRIRENQESPSGDTAIDATSI